MATATRDRQDMPAEELTTEIAKALLTGALPGEITGFDDEAVAAAAAFVTDAAARRRPGEPALRLESVAGSRRFMRLAIINDDMPFLSTRLRARSTRTICRSIACSTRWSPCAATKTAR